MRSAGGGRHSYSSDKSVRATWTIGCSSSGGLFVPSVSVSTFRGLVGSLIQARERDGARWRARKGGWCWTGDRS